MLSIHYVHDNVTYKYTKKCRMPNSFMAKMCQFFEDVEWDGGWCVRI